MKTFFSRTAASLAVVAAVSMTATPVLAHDRYDWHRHYHHDGIDGGDLLAGLLVIGGIAAIASAASKADTSDKADVRDEPGRYPGGPGYAAPDDRGYVEVPSVQDHDAGSYPGGPRAGDSFDAAVDACSGEIERGERRIGSVDNVRRMDGRYSVEGHLQDGRGFACSVDDTGQIRSVAVDGRALI